MGHIVTRRELVMGLAGGVSLTSAAFGAEPWSGDELMSVEALGKRVAAGNAPPIFCVAFPNLYRQRHIRGAKLAGPGSKPEGIKELEEAASSLSKSEEVVLYCGCCPMADCPNIRPAYTAMKRMGFQKIRVLNIPKNLHNDWTTKGHPTEPPAAPRITGD